MTHDLSDKIQELIRVAYLEETAGAEYQDSFADEGPRKAQYVIDDLRYRQATNQISLNRLGYLCIGGADGSEVEHVLMQTEISKAVMVEISADAVRRAATRESRLSAGNKQSRSDSRRCHRVTG